MALKVHTRLVSPCLPFSWVLFPFPKGNLLLGCLPRTPPVKSFNKHFVRLVAIINQPWRALYLIQDQLVFDRFHAPRIGLPCHPPPPFRDLHFDRSQRIVGLKSLITYKTPNGFSHAPLLVYLCTFWRPIVFHKILVPLWTNQTPWTRRKPNALHPMPIPHCVGFQVPLPSSVAWPPFSPPFPFPRSFFALPFELLLLLFHRPYVVHFPFSACAIPLFWPRLQSTSFLYFSPFIVIGFLLLTTFINTGWFLVNFLPPQSPKRHHLHHTSSFPLACPWPCRFFINTQPTVRFGPGPQFEFSECFILLFFFVLCRTFLHGFLKFRVYHRLCILCLSKEFPLFVFGFFFICPPFASGFRLFPVLHKMPSPLCHLSSPIRNRPMFNLSAPGLIKSQHP